MCRLISITLLASIITVPIYFFFLRSPPPLPQLQLNEWWGPESLKGQADDSVKPFKVEFSNSMIQELRQRIKTSRTFQAPLEGVTHEYGFNSQELPSWLKYWAEEYKFEDRQKFFNQYPQFKTNIQGLDIHFIRVKPEVPKGVETVPLLLIHGWPGSVREFYEAIPLLTSVQDGRDFAVELIIPSLPGYGFSDAAVRPGLGAAEIAVILRNLMARLGYNKFYVQGGDWGSIIGSNMATLFPEAVLGYHSNMAFNMAPLATALEFVFSIYPPLVVDKELEDRMYPLSNIYSRLIQETGYMHLQATKPDTIGVCLSDSPAGLLAYFLEKFSTWTDHSQRPVTDYFTKDQLIDNLMCYWSTNTITTSMRLYAETFNKKHLGYKLDEIPTAVPTWVIQTKYELGYQPPFLLKMKYPNLIHVTVLQDGGHFLAFEKPKEFSLDVLRAIGEFRKLNKNVKTEL